VAFPQMKYGEVSILCTWTLLVRNAEKNNQWRKRDISVGLVAVVVGSQMGAMANNRFDLTQAFGFRRSSVC